LQRAFALYTLQMLAADKDTASAQLPKGLLLYFQKDRRAYEALRERLRGKRFG
jgi:hypothetical protein